MTAKQAEAQEQVKKEISSAEHEYRPQCFSS
jgi:hypothetical protein